MDKVKFKIDGIPISANSDETILQAAKKVGITIPSLCQMKIEGTDYANDCAACRVCLVEVAGRKDYIPSCATKVSEGMNIITNSPELIENRKDIIELILSNHGKDCLRCPKSSSCDLQTLANNFNIGEPRYNGTVTEFEKDYTASMTRNMNKCLRCRRCNTMCDEIQDCGIISIIDRGFGAKVSAANESKILDTACSMCGQCVHVCPVGAINEKDYSWSVLKAMNDKSKTIAFLVDPSIRVTIGEEFQDQVGLNFEKKLVSALKIIGAKHIFDTSVAVDVTIHEKVREIKERYNNILQGEDNTTPIITSTCPSWIKYLDLNYPKVLEDSPILKSPQQILSSYIKEVWAEENDISKENLITVSIIPCLGKKYESTADYPLHTDSSCDYTINTKEISKILRSSGIQLDLLPESEFDSPFSRYSAGAILEGRVGGLTESILSEVFEELTESEFDSTSIKEAYSTEGPSIVDIHINEVTLKVAIADGLKEIKELVKLMKDKKQNFDFIEASACKGGCVGGSGQPMIDRRFPYRERSEGLELISRDEYYRKSSENIEAIAIIEKYVHGIEESPGNDFLYQTYPKE